MNEIPKSEIEPRIHEICNYILNKEIDGRIDLMNGEAGEILFLAYYSKYYSRYDLQQTIHSKLEYVFNEINHGSDYPTFSSGISGINWVLEHLVKSNFIDFDLDGLYSETDDLLYDWMMHFVGKKNYDFLHGALGIAIYFANRNTSKTNRFVNKFIDALADDLTEIEETNCLGLLSEIKSEKKGNYGYNFSLSHGMTSLLYFLDKCTSILDLDDKGKSKKIMDGILNFFEYHKNDLSTYNTFYPSWVGENTVSRNSRIGWCYGDLGIASVFMNLNNKQYIDKYPNHAIELIDHTLTRTNPEKESILDAGICHGSSGLALIYDLAYRKTGKEEYLQSSEYWLKHCLDENRHTDAPLGYKAYRNREEGWVADAGFIEGVSGIGLVLLSKISVENTGWVECLLLK